MHGPKGEILMSKVIRIVETRLAHGSEHVIVDAASYNGSAPFSGIFEVFDLDTCLTTDPADGRVHLTVQCQFGDQDDEDASLVLELPNGAIGVIGQVGNEVEVIARLDFT